MTSTSTDYLAPVSVPVPVQVTLTATAVADSLKSDSAIVTTFSPGTIALHLSPTSADLTPGQTAQFVATVDNDPTHALVTWTITQNGFWPCTSFCGRLSSTSTASGDSITYFAPAALLSPVKLTILAASSVDPSASASAKVTVRCFGPSCIP
jgi:hypothetical protein